MKCERCGGLLTADQHRWLKMARCLICGDRFDSKILSNRRFIGIVQYTGSRFERRIKEELQRHRDKVF